MKLSVPTIIMLSFCCSVAFGVILSGSEGPTKVKSKSEMQTSFAIDENGKLTATTRTWTSDKLFGFTGGVFITLLDEAKAVVWNSEQQKYGVNGKWIPGDSDRTEKWTAQVPTSVLPQVRSYAIVHQHTPTNRVFQWIKENYGTIISIAKAIISSG